jgi:putative transposase
MTATLTHKIRLDPNKSQNLYFCQACGTARFAWNWGLAKWNETYKSGGKPTAENLKLNFNSIKAEQFPWTFDVTKYASQQPFLNLKKAFNNFFQKRAKRPRFKKKGRHDSFYIGGDQIQIEDKKIKIPKLGWVRMKERLRFSGHICSVTISRTAGLWFASVHVQVDTAFPSCENQATVGVDLGVNRLATLSTGEFVTGPAPLKVALKKLARFQRRFARTQKGSANRERQRRKIARLHYRISCVRSNALHQLTSSLTKRFGQITIEDLNVRGMTSSAKGTVAAPGKNVKAKAGLNRAILDAGFFEFRRQLSYKADLYRNHVAVADRWFPSSKGCSRCGSIDRNLALADRMYRCKSCGLEVDRDLNAAMRLNSYSTASFAETNACGHDGSAESVLPVPQPAWMKQEPNEDALCHENHS